MPDMNPCDVLIVGAEPGSGSRARSNRLAFGEASTLRSRSSRTWLITNARRAKLRMMSPNIPHHGNLPAAWSCGKGPRCRAAGGLSARHQLPHHVYRAGADAHSYSLPPRSLHEEGWPSCNWPTPEPPHRINQIFLEPILFEHAAAQPRVRIISQTVVEDVRIEDNSANAALRLVFRPAPSAA